MMSDHSFILTQKHRGHLLQKVSVRLRTLQRLAAHQHNWCNSQCGLLSLCDTCGLLPMKLLYCPQGRSYNQAVLCAHHFNKTFAHNYSRAHRLCHITQWNQSSFVKRFLNLLLLRPN